MKSPLLTVHSPAAVLHTRRAPLLLPLCILGLLSVFTVWAAWAKVDEVTRASGRVIPQSHEQVIQSLDSGILAEMLVREGDLVEKDQVLLRIDDTRSGAVYREIQTKTLALEAQAARLRAETVGGTPVFPPEVRAATELVTHETSAWRSRTEAVNASVEGLRRGLVLLEDEIRITEPLAKRGLVSEIDVLRLKRQANDMRLQISDRVNRFRADANTELSRVSTELAQSREMSTVREDSVKRATMRAPMRGRIKNIRITTLGGVIQPGQEIMEITPEDGRLMIEAFIRPSDMAFIRPGLEASIKLSAYTFSTYGGLKGKLELVSPNALRTERPSAPNAPGQSQANTDEGMFRALISTDVSQLRDQRTGKPLDIIPGMTAEVDILTGQKTVLDYLLKPLTRLNQALTEK